MVEVLKVSDQKWREIPSAEKKLMWRLRAGWINQGGGRRMCLGCGWGNAFSPFSPFGVLHSPPFSFPSNNCYLYVPLVFLFIRSFSLKRLCSDFLLGSPISPIRLSTILPYPNGNRFILDGRNIYYAHGLWHFFDGSGVLSSGARLASKVTRARSAGNRRRAASSESTFGR